MNEWGFWREEESNDTALKTQDSKLKNRPSAPEHAMSRWRRLPMMIKWADKKHFVTFKLNTIQRSYHESSDATDEQL